MVVEKLRDWVEKRHLVLLKLDQERSLQLLESQLGVNRFTFARPHDDLKPIRPWSVCIVQTS